MKFLSLVLLVASLQSANIVKADEYVNTSNLQQQQLLMIGKTRPQEGTRNDCPGPFCPQKPQVNYQNENNGCVPQYEVQCTPKPGLSQGQMLFRLLTPIKLQSDEKGFYPAYFINGARVRKSTVDNKLPSNYCQVGVYWNEPHEELEKNGGLIPAGVVPLYYVAWYAFDVGFKATLPNGSMVNFYVDCAINTKSSPPSHQTSLAAIRRNLRGILVPLEQ